MRNILLAASLFFSSVVQAQTDAPYGSWSSPLSIADVTQSSAALDSLMADGDGLYALEQRPAENGRTVVVKIGGAENVSITPEGFDVGSRVHEYGGGAAIVREGVVYFSNRSDNRLYAQKIGEAPRALTPAGPWRYADCDVDARRARLICVREDHTNLKPSLVKNALVAVPFTGESAGDILYKASDFVASPRVSPDGDVLVFVAWNHPNMPWDHTSLLTSTFDVSGKFIKITAIVPATAKESVMQPMWGPYGSLFYISDRSGYWNIYRKTNTGTVVVGSNTVDIGGPAWTFGDRAYVPLSFDRVAAAVTRNAVSRLAIMSASANRYTYAKSDVVSAGSFAMIGDRAFALAATPTRGAEIVSMDARAELLIERENVPALAADTISRGGEVIFDNRKKQKVFAWYYPPKNAAFVSQVEALPPLMVLAHGGPTSHSGPEYRKSLQFWTTRGFAVLDVNYSGSSGYGRDYRQRLRRQWGDIDVADVAYAAMALAQQGKVDRQRMVIMGGSAGGLVVLSALATYPDVAGLNSFGVSDFAALASDTHKFESRYLDTLVGKYPQMKKIYDARSPINHVDKITAPLLILQGQDDNVVPPSQSTKIANALRSRKSPVAYVAFPGEGHGFRSGEAKQRALEMQMSFLSQILNVKFADTVPPLAIEHWPMQK
jgi:dienelactone hydrolase